MAFLPAIAVALLVHTTIISQSTRSSLSMSSTAATDASAYNDYVSAAVEISQAHFSPLTQTLSFVRSVRDIDSNKRRKYLYSLPNNAEHFLPPTELNDRIKIRVPSPSGDKVAVFVTHDSDPQLQHLEIWTCGGQFLEQRILLPKKLHGNVIADTAGGFGRSVWNPSETAIVYAAERVAPKTCSFFADPEEETNDENKQSADTVRGGENTIGLGKTESWGEKYSKQSALLDLFVVHTVTRQIGRIENVPTDGDRSTTLGDYTLGQAIWSPDGDSVVYVAWDAGGGQQMPRRLGLTYCMQRPSQLCRSRVGRLLQRLSGSNYQKSVDDQTCTDEPYQVLSPDVRVARSPRFSPTHDDGLHTLIFLSARRPFDSHLGCFGLDAMIWKNGEPIIEGCYSVVPQVWKPDSDAGDTVAGLPFPGLFTVELPETCFLSPFLLLATTQWGSCQKLVRISIADKSIILVNAGSELDSNTLLAIASDGSAFIASTASNSPHCLFRVPESSLRSESAIDASHAVVLPQVLPCSASRFSVVNKLPNLGFTLDVHKLEDVPVFPGTDQELTVQSILLMPNKNQFPNPPVIVVPHGGPHSASSTAYLPSNAFLCEYGGYALLLVNYRGSVGFGQASVEALPSRCGDMDLKDIIAATDQLKESGIVDTERIGICGGSHGGFLTAHATSQYPDYFKAAAMRNPVVNIASMVTSTDIPDWCYYETLGTPYHWNEYRPPTKEELVAMYDCSPVKHVGAVKTPTLIALGLSDLRVPPSQGMEWYHSLRSKGVPTKLLTYDDDDHAIGGVVSEADHWINIKQWFDQYLK
ncbi:hypothetical protein MPSEU_000391600 [Mayamaea pseudoterrestris]|nr:hypothetical protein MPSEU_000391600 [Mayamaea pseudoterrestris]